MYKFALVLVVVCLPFVLTTTNKRSLVQSAARINSLQKSWKAGVTAVSLLSESQKQSLFGAVIPRENEIKRTKFSVRNDLPSEFDPRQQWSGCPSLWAIKDQGRCGDCWAVSTASAASDRLCIVTNYNTKVNLSAENLMTCCSECAKNGGCNGGISHIAWSYIQNTGIVTGGDYGSNEGCQPYQIPPSSTPAVVREHKYTPPCETDCINPDYTTPYNQDLHYASSSYVLPEDETQIQNDLYTNGPNVAGFDVYEDLLQYKSGVYHHVWGEKKGAHAVRVLGWGTDPDSGEDYWLVANSWNRTFGENGYFRIRRMTNNCKFEDHITGGVMSS